ncbi:ABC transporter ATP-binding protein [Microbispora sp. ATCC PTA-5024]|uniref:ABC transporter ATP-binding protein n=1 Tax=Microbispora sp. ATCC PTA-5024 TaxID=316330 RepID=UPI0003DB7F4C|nr:ATP-binding cassette domain-containing protein [Microbispora sp. ATCC PTA-5024]ETK33585.1 hypothetical protein MPTA5024_23400 [Microbispora sp. ATCC PTA-5024]
MAEEARAAFAGAEVRARGLGLRGRHGWVYRDVTLDAGPGTLTAVQGEAGSGRTSLLLTLAGRMRHGEGTLAVGGHTSPRAIRRVAALGLFPDVNPLDDALSVREHLHERMRPHGLLWRRGNGDVVTPALARAGLDPAALPEGDRTLARDLTRDQAVRLGIALALLDGPGLLLVDDFDDGIPADGRHALWATLRGLADAGLTVVAACTDAREAAEAASLVLPLTGRDGDAHGDDPQDRDGDDPRDRDGDDPRDRDEDGRDGDEEGGLR